MTDTPNFQLQPHLDDLYARAPRQLAFRAQSGEEFALWQQTLRAKLRELLGIAGRTLPTTVRVERLQAIDRGEYVEEKYRLDTGVDTPIYVLIPKTAPPYKAVLVFHGHDPSVQYILGNYPDEETAQRNLAADNNYAQALAQAGYLVCAVEQRGFGERITEQIHGADFRSACRHVSFEYLMQGRTLLGERCWDGMVALKYLQTRDDVVEGGIGCTGNSGGGTTCMFLSALDERISVSIPSCYFCSFKDSILSMYHCECNYVPHILEYGEMGDLAALIAPRPLCIISGEHDPIYPVRGTRAQFETVRRAYDLLGASERCWLAVHPGEHAYNHAFSQEWFRQWL
jgi:hypothetical protein